MNAMQTMNTYADQIALIAEAMQAAANVKAANKETADAAGSTLVSRVKDYANVTAADGVEVEIGRKALQLGLTGLEAPAGSVKASGNHYAGFRKLISLNKDISTLSTRDAQEAIESDEVKAVKAAKKALNDYAKANKWTSKDWNALLEMGGITGGTVEDDATASEVEAVREAVAA